MAQEPQDYAFRFRETQVVLPDDDPINIYDFQGYDDYLMADAGRFVIRGDIGGTIGGSVYGSQILLQGIDTRELKYACIDTARIRDLAVTDAKVESITWNKGQGGTLTLGGISNISGVLDVVNAAGTSFAGITNAGMYFGSGNDIFKASASGIQLGHATFASAPFRVDMQGNLTATSATITGSITSTSGTIAGWTIGTSTLSKNNATLDSAGALTLGTSNDIVKLSAADATYRMWVGNATAASAPFRVTKAGALTATSAAISGTITLGGSSGSKGSLSLQNSSNTEIVLVDNTGVNIKNGGNMLVQQGGDIDLRSGSTSNAAEIRWLKASDGVKEFTLRLVEGTPNALLFYAHQSGRDFEIGDTVSPLNDLELTASNVIIRKSTGGATFLSDGSKLQYGVLEKLHQFGLIEVNLSAGSGTNTTVTHNLGNGNYYVMLCNEQSRTGAGYMDYVIHSVGDKTDNTFKIYYTNRSTTNTAVGNIYWQMYHT